MTLNNPGDDLAQYSNHYNYNAHHCTIIGADPQHYKLFTSH